MRRVVCIVVMGTLALALMTLVACGPLPLPAETPVIYVAVPLGTPEGTSDQPATLAAVQTQVQDNADAQAVATAEIVRANAQATLDSANATLSAAQLQDQNNANIIAAQLAATAEVIRANAQATLVAANSTQSAALTQDALRQTQAQYDLQGTAVAIGTQTAVANLIATQTQSSLATSQWYDDQVRQRDAERQVPITFLWMWCLPIFIVVLAVLALWGFYRWLMTRQANQHIIELPPVEKLDAPVNPVNLQDRFIPPGNDIIDGSYLPEQPNHQVHGWMDEIKGKLMESDEDENDTPDS
jgi:hypothetical protein